MSDSRGSPKSSQLVPDSADDVQQASSSSSSNLQSSDSIVEYTQTPDAVSSLSCEVKSFNIDQPSAESVLESDKSVEADEIRAGLDTSYVPGISDNKKAPESEVSQASVTSENVQSRTPSEKSHILTNILASGNSNRRKTSQSASQSVQEAAKNLDNSPDLLEIEHSSPKKKPKLKSFGGPEVGISFQAAASTHLQQTILSLFSKYMVDAVFNEKYNEYLEARQNNTERRNKLLAETFEVESEEKKFLKRLLNKIEEIFEAFLRAKVFLLTKFTSALTSNAIRDVRHFCSDFDALKSDSAENLDIEKELEKEIPVPYPSSLQNWWSEYAIIVDFLKETSDNIVGMVISADNDRKTKCENYARLCAIFLSFLHQSSDKLVQQEKSMGEDFFSLFEELNMSLIITINDLQKCSNELFSYLNNIRVKEETIED